MQITLIDGRKVDRKNIFFNEDTYHFYLAPSGEDITDNIKRADKQSGWSNFDPYKDNLRLSTGDANTPPLNESVWLEFVKNVATDPLSAPLDSLNNAVDKLIDSPAFRKLAIVAGVAVAVLLMVRLTSK